MAKTTITMRMDTADLAVLDSHCNMYGANRTATVRLMIDLLKTPEYQQAFMDLVMDSKKS